LRLTPMQCWGARTGHQGALYEGMGATTYRSVVLCPGVLGDAAGMVAPDGGNFTP
jgi:hypothetical protein